MQDAEPANSLTMLWVDSMAAIADWVHAHPMNLGQAQVRTAGALGPIEEATRLLCTISGQVGSLAR